MKTNFHSSLMICMVALLMVIAPFALAHDAHTEATPEIPQVIILATENGIEVPEVLPQGLVTIVFDNRSEVPIVPLPARLREEVTQEDFLEALMTGGPFAALPLISMQGAALIMPEASFKVTYDLAAGEYVLINFAAEIPELYWFDVAEQGDAVEYDEPEADVVVLLLDFAFGMPVTIEAGEQLWKLENQGGQWHEMGLMRVDETLTNEEIFAMLAELAENAGPEGDEEGPQPDFIWIPMDSQERAWFTLDLKPGKYVIGCFLPDITSEEGHVHIELGMVHILTVE
jgi:hypothetical protein